MGFEANARTREREKREGRVSEEAEPREAGGEKIPSPAQMCNDHSLWVVGAVFACISHLHPI